MVETMTPAQIDQMSAGEELDGLISKYIRGLPNHLGEQGSFLPEYSAKIEYAWEVVEQMKASGWDFVIGGDSMINRKWFARFDHERHLPVFAQADTAPLAICHAALKAKSKMGS